ncbi:MAG: prepilin-type N-terminal cleavage/methylation domain-containing protein [Candidatus Omnitrophica bacterium]|nr:prepilin-type N-terminal cleavage/methylation domain-containing protein [Candidatus Omnitrophota bacterium]
MPLFLHIWPNKNNKFNLGVFTPLETRQQRRSTGASSNLFLTGFTLVELLIAVAIFSVVSIAIFSTFSSGAAVLRRVKTIDFSRQKTLLKIERFSRELRILPDCRKHLFLGAKTKISFPGNVDYIPCRITYYFDSSALCLMRVVDKLSEIITSEGKVEAEFKSKPEVFLSNVKGIKLRYFKKPDINKNEYIWMDEWNQNYLPMPGAIELTINTDDQEYVSTIFLPKT